MGKKGHTIKVTARDKDVTKYLLNAYKIPYTLVGQPQTGPLSLTKEWIERGYHILKIGKKFDADIYLGVLNPITAIVAKLLRKKSITLTDTEFADFANTITIPFTDSVLTSYAYKKDFGNKQIRYDGCHELAYLNPKYFKPNPVVLDDIGLQEDDNFFLIRFASLSASHDNHCVNFKKEFIKTLVSKLDQHGKVIISSEIKLDPYLQKYAFKLSPEKYQHLLYYSTMYIGESSTSAEEAAILGTPSIYFERWNINGKYCGSTPYVGILDELQNKYGILYSFYEEKELLNKVHEMLPDISIEKKNWKEKSKKFLSDKIDVTAFLMWFTENYPDSIFEMKDNPLIQYRFK